MLLKSRIRTAEIRNMFRMLVAKFIRRFSFRKSSGNSEDDIKMYLVENCRCDMDWLRMLSVRDLWS